jgi:hypothetical protein
MSNALCAWLFVGVTVWWGWGRERERERVMSVLIEVGGRREE